MVGTTSAQLQRTAAAFPALESSSGSSSQTCSSTSMTGSRCGTTLAPASRPILRSGAVLAPVPTTLSWVVSSLGATTNPPQSRRGALRPFIRMRCGTHLPQFRFGLITGQAPRRMGLFGPSLIPACLPLAHSYQLKGIITHLRTHTASHSIRLRCSESFKSGWKMSRSATVRAQSLLIFCRIGGTQTALLDTFGQRTSLVILVSMFCSDV